MMDKKSEDAGTVANTKEEADNVAAPAVIESSEAIVEKSVEESGEETKDTTAKTEVLPRTSKNASEREADHRNRIIRTAIACFMGILVGVLSYFLVGDTTTVEGGRRAVLGFLLLLAGIVFQKHVMMLLKIDYTTLGGKDWFYHGFMTFAMWYISWAILLMH